MFNTKRIKNLEWEVDNLKLRCDKINKRNWELLEKIELLAAQQGLHFAVKPSERVLVKSK